MNAEHQESVSGAHPPFALGRTVGWSIYLGMSWTWCIGMFLPVLLLRDLGIGGFIVFAIPNVLGAAAMGWVLRDPASSRKLIHENRTACIWFSLVTIVFHGFFATWMIRRIGGPNSGLALAAVFAFFWMVLQIRGGRFIASGLALATSVGVMAWGFMRKDLPGIAHPTANSALPPIDILWLSLVCLFGFGLCPYLDLTFHAARETLGRAEAKVAFALGFGGFFLAMILATVCYSDWFVMRTDPNHLILGFDRARFPQISLILSTHLIVQSCLTVALHLEQLRPGKHKIPVSRFLIFSGLLIGAAILGTIDRREQSYNGLGLGEISYRCFLGFYGLVFPTYVWLRMIHPRKSLTLFYVVVVVTAPLFWMAFIEKRMIFLIPGVLIPIAARLLPNGHSAAHLEPAAN